eukprot:GEMP01062988.1.p1 GENE.GEMP01062988.1~~GEMP01062988.1.p1  ORF type:complete len:329 (+),score=39.69 GEMP01062988.1:121-1107(+)
MNHYEVLDVSPHATQNEIRRRYLALMLLLHPDKNPEQKAPADTGLSGREIQFHEVQEACRTLGNPARRFLYDIRTLGQSQVYPEHDESFFVQLRMTEAIREVERMAAVHQKILAREMQRSGIIVTLALYGAYEKLVIASKRPLDPLMGMSTVVDVTIPVQCLVDHAKIIITGGKTKSKADLPGFYSPILPSEDIETGLLVRYTFHKVLHQVVSRDCEAIFIPKKSQIVDLTAANDSADVPSLNKQPTKVLGAATSSISMQPSAVAVPADGFSVVFKMISALSSVVSSASNSSYYQSLSPFIMCAVATVVVSTLSSRGSSFQIQLFPAR